MMTVEGEQVWVPKCKQELVAGLKRMGIFKVAGVPGAFPCCPKREIHPT